jgi:UDP-N-acetylglucosamine transferase subunit ALG13
MKPQPESRPVVTNSHSQVDPQPPHHTEIMVAVGTDHHPFDRMIEWVDAWAAAHPEVSVLVQRGTSQPSVACDSVELLPHPELCERFARARVVVSHGGPSTVMDARMGGSRPIVVARDPERGEHVDDHQQRFAEHLRRHDLAEVIDTQQQFAEALDEALARPERYTVPVEATDITGVVEFGRVLDQLLGVQTELMPSTPSPLLDGAELGPAPAELPASPQPTQNQPASQLEESQR